MDELLAWLFVAAVQFSGLPAFEPRPTVTAMPYASMLRELCDDHLAELRRMFARYANCTLGSALRTERCVPLQPDSAPYTRCLGQHGLVAAYLIDQRRIVYRDDLDLQNDADNSFIVHEFVHALQDRATGARQFASCAGALAAERQAYAVQQKYLRSRGQMLRVGDRLRGVGCGELR
jgi:hypothetical protein